MANSCKICLRRIKVSDDLCWRHRRRYVYESDINGYRLKKAKNGSATRHIKKKFHSHEISLTKILESYYGISDIVTSYHPSWALSTKGALLEYDILIKSKKLLIEYNGIQHYKFIKMFHKTKANFEAQRQRDILKTSLAKENGYNLVVFKYDEPLIEDYIIMKLKSILNG